MDFEEGPCGTGRHRGDVGDGRGHLDHGENHVTAHVRIVGVDLAADGL